MLVAASLASAFTLPSRLPPLASSARCTVVHMGAGDGKSDRYNFEDPRQILDNFFNPGGTRMPKVFKRGGKGGKDTGGSKDAAEELLVEVLAELKTMETADWGLMDTQETQPAAGDTKYFSGL